MKRPELALPSYSHPVTAFLLDDNAGYTSSLIPQLPQKHFVYKAFTQPEELLAAMAAHKPNTAISHTLEAIKQDTNDGKTQVWLDPSQVFQQIYDITRFATPMVLLLDFDLRRLDIDGVGVSRQLRKYELLNIIMLAGALFEKDAVKGLSQGDFDQYILKYNPAYKQLLNESLERGRLAGFEALSKSLYGWMRKCEKESPLNFQTFRSFVFHMMEKHGFCEHYRADHYGTQLLLKSGGEPHGLHVMTEARIEKLLAGPQAAQAPVSLLQDLRKGVLMLCVLDTDNPTWLPPGDEWPNYVHDAQPLVLDDKLVCHYALVRGSILVDEKRIATFDDYKKQLPLQGVAK